MGTIFSDILHNKDGFQIDWCLSVHKKLRNFAEGFNDADLCGCVQDNMLLCDACDRGVHLQCCKPPVLRPPEGREFYRDYS